MTGKKKTDSLSKFSNLTEKQQRELLLAASPYFWIKTAQINLVHSYWHLDGYEYIVAPLEEMARLQCIIKGAQSGWTENVGILKTLHGMINGRYPKGVLYLFPTYRDVLDFTKTRFDPIIQFNSVIAGQVGDVDSAGTKSIAGATLYLRGAKSTKRVEGEKETASGLKSISVDKVVYDERDEMEDEMVELAHYRIEDSEVKEELFISTPTIPDIGIDALYKKSDQRVWVIKCEKCNKYTCLELEFPNCLVEKPDGKVIRACKKCGAEIYPRNGVWVPQYPDRSKDLIGWWISRLCSVRTDPKDILKRFRTGRNVGEFYNSMLGKAYIAAENRLQPNDVYACCGSDVMLESCEEPTCAGVDIGKRLHIVIARKPGEGRLKVVKITSVHDYNELYDVLKRFTVKSCVIDELPELHKTRDFQRNHPEYGVFVCRYREHYPGQTEWNDKAKLVTVNRTEICDATHELVKTPGRLELPRRNNVVKEYAKQMCGIAKVLKEDKDTGSKKYTYRPVESTDDHYRHATNYCLLASERVSSGSFGNVVAKYLQRRRRRTWMTV